ncbi:polysaccharide lyase family 8 super-sandwich domain-containing protein [Pseudozobellia sp. WGM2]|uniref:polysaccharide lyase family 8 super-sandwich domain-containing protein n=1 Tax=Pseudozobellia sp. WGM2 TaxID=2787625 RepID=UPI001ADFF497|nr:polysaccharide lyase family 8 super-sandwich domain-containing protein [Pseudozobellia sp. WGM2]
MKKRSNYLSLSLLLLFISPVIASETDFDIIKDRVLAKIMTPVGDYTIDGLITTLRDDGTWPGIDYTDVSREGFLHRVHADNMLKIAKAYQSESSKFYENVNAKKSVELALNNWLKNDYICDNWWYNQIGIPNTMVQLMLVIGKDLPEDLVLKTQPIINRANINAQGARPGGDRVKIAGIEAKNMLFLDNHKNFKAVLKVIENEIKQVEWIGMNYGYGFRDGEGGFATRTAGGRGIQYDNSFHHRGDGVNNTLSYGLNYASAFIEWALYVVDTEYSFSNQKTEALIDYFLDGICKTAIFGKLPDPGAKNRSISRPGTLKPYSPEMAQGLLKVSSHRKTELEEIVAIRENKMNPTKSHATFFRHTEHFTFQRPEFFTSVRMYSTRTHNMEEPYNSEGLLNHHRGDGANHISVRGDEYFDIWPVYDFQKIPGTTVVQKDNMPAPEEVAKLGVTDFVGAATDGRFGAVAFDFKSLADTLAARKSWFFFDDSYVCLGAGISSDKEKFPVFTTLNQSLLRSEVTVSQNTTTTKIGRGEKTFEDINWVFQDGIGYIFPKPTKVYIKNKTETGDWWRINKQVTSSKEKVSLDVFTIGLDHGLKPKNASYEYVVVPATSIKSLEQMSTDESISILSNSPYLQAVGQNELGIYQIVFYKAGNIKITEGLELISHTPGILMIKLDGDKIKEITVADPNRELGKMHISVSTKLNKISDKFKAIWNKKEQVSEITVDLPQGVNAGESVNLSF